MYSRSSKCCRIYHRYLKYLANYFDYTSDLNNTIGVADPRFGLLVNDAAVVGMGSVTDPDCLQASLDMHHFIPLF
jgi:radical SAM superfamily enzyme